jgi:hypothetical protein
MKVRNHAFKENFDIFCISQIGVPCEALHTIIPNLQYIKRNSVRLQKRVIRTNIFTVAVFLQTGRFSLMRCRQYSIQNPYSLSTLYFHDKLSRKPALLYAANRYGRAKFVDSLIFNLDSKWRWVISFTSQPLYHWWKRPPDAPWIWGCVDTRAGLYASGERENFLPGSHTAVGAFFVVKNAALQNLICSYERIKGIFGVMWRSPCGTLLCLFNNVLVNCMQLIFSINTSSFVFENRVNFVCL